MALPKPTVDYRNFRLSKINQEEYRHLWLLLLWPVYLLRYIIIENLNPAAQYYSIHCALDDMIPFHEGFLIPYVIWYVFIVGMHLYTMLYDIPAFRQYTKFMAISLTMSTCIFLLFPSCQNLRPLSFERENILTYVVQLIYRVDTNTNVFPSEHVIGSMAVLAAAIHTKSLRTPKRITAIAITAFFTSIATVFLKQHSVLDVIAALPICIIAYWICYGKKRQKTERNTNVMIKLLCAAVALIPALIAVLLFYLANALFSAPGALLGTVQPTIAELCIVAGVVLLIPTAIVLAIALLNLAGRKKKEKEK